MTGDPHPVEASEAATGPIDDLIPQLRQAIDAGTVQPDRMQRLLTYLGPPANHNRGGEAGFAAGGALLLLAMAYGVLGEEEPDGATAEDPADR